MNNIIEIEKYDDLSCLDDCTYVIVAKELSDDHKTVHGIFAMITGEKVNIPINKDIVIINEIKDENSIFNYEVNQVTECDNSSIIVFKKPLNGITDSSQFAIIDKEKYDEVFLDE